MIAKDGKALLDCGWTMESKNGHFYFYDEEGDFVARGPTIAEAIIAVEMNLKLMYMAVSKELAQNALPEGGIEA